jgi:CelD/BcsL family acetyltransferase involved in cellulose biosynthesis
MHNASGRQPDRFEIVDNFDAFKCLKGDWEALSARISQLRFSQSFVWCCTSWEAVEGPRGRSLHCVVARNRGRAVLIWPFTLYRKSYLVVAAPLGCVYSEYPEPLVEPGPEAEQRIDAAWDVLRKRCGCDVITLRHVREGSAVHRLMCRNKEKPILRKANHYVKWRGHETWESYARTLSTMDLSSDTRRRQRRLEERGTVTFDVVEGPECAPVIDWTLTEKVKQLARTNRRGPWLGSRAYRDLLIGGASRGGRWGRVAAFVLKFENQIIATQLARIDQSRIEALVMVYDGAFSRYGPGKTLQLASLRWAFERGLEFDLRGGDEPYKRRLATHETSVFNFRCVNSALYAACLRCPGLVPFARRYRALKDKATGAQRRR